MKIKDKGVKPMKEEGIVLSFQSERFGDLIFDLKSLTVINRVNWEKLWYVCDYDPYEYAYKIGTVFDYFYLKYGVEHNYEPEIYTETLGNLKICLTINKKQYLVYLNLDSESYIIEQPTIDNY